MSAPGDRLRSADPDVDLRPKQPEKSIGELFAQLTSDMSTLMRQEVELAKVEAKDEAKKAGRAGAMLGAGGLVSYLALTLASFAAAWGLSEIMPEGFAFLIVAAVWAAVAAVLMARGRRELRNVQPLPETTQSLKEDAEWARTQRS
jgi:uncharacterized membrane protein YqjE